MQPIIITVPSIRQAARRFKKEFPRHAAKYADELALARKLVKAQSVYRADALGFLVGDGKKTQVYKVDKKRCACGEPMCAHRLAVNLFVIAEEFEERAQARRRVAEIEDALESNEVHEELAESEGNYA